MRTRTINQALVRPETVAGCEKVPLGICVASAILFGMMAWWFWSLPALAMCILIFSIGLPIVRRMGKADPQLTTVYVANLWLRAFYPARAPAHIPDTSEDGRKSHAGLVGTIGIALITAAWMFGSVLLFVAGILALVLGIPLARLASR